MTYVVALSLVAFSAAGYESELIFPPQDKHCHGSSIVEAPNGDLIACWFYGSGERSANDVKVQGARLRKGENEWSDVFTMADTPDHPDCNPTLFIDSKDRLWLFWIVVQANRWEQSLLKYRRAEKYRKDGAPEWSWQDIILLKPGEEFVKATEEKFEELNMPKPMWGEYALQYTRLIIEASKDPLKRQLGWMTRAKPVQLESGRILVPLYSDGFNAGLVSISDDHGETWRPSLPMIGFAPIQPTIFQKKSGQLVAYCRDSGGPPQRVLMSTSDDNGDTWSAARDTDIPNPGASIAAVTLKDGRWVHVFNDAEDARYSLAVALSDDEGATWKSVRHLDVIERGEGGFAYPTAIEGKDGRIHVTYTHSRDGKKSIKHASFTPEWVVEGD
ncbi:MAG: sialidase family protein [Candidatus Hydrogenedentes bacterium]|nr:sialidase family protein [Candidatus Hydrogenedentota bacterium]